VTRRTLLAALSGLASVAASTRVGEPAPNFRLQTAGGEWLELQSLRGSLVLLNFWATWCAPCRRELPALDAIAREFHPRGVRVVGVAVDESGWRAVRPFLAQYKIGFPVVLADRDTRRHYRRDIDVLPCTLLLGRDGLVLARFNTALEEDAFRTLLNEALTREPKTAA